MEKRDSMTALLRTSTLLLLLSLFTLEAPATIIYHRKLHQVINGNRPIVMATVVSSQTQILANELRVTVKAEHIGLVFLSAPAGSVYVHSFRTDLERRGPDGSKVRLSPIRDGSGLEQNLVPGERYLFIFSEDKKRLIRVEPASKIKEVRKLLAEVS